ncbi:MAG: carboxypeptidase M32 [Rhizobiaceae bacterium]
MPNSTYDALLAHVRTSRALAQIAGLLSWDQEVMMPPNGATSRAEQAAALEEVSHQRNSDPRLGDWLDELDGAELNAEQAANVRLTRRSYERTCNIPSSLATELARTTSRAQGIWAEARQANDFKQFSPILENIIELKRQEAACLAKDGQSAYDALLNDFEPGMKVAELQPLLEGLRPRLSSLRQRISESSRSQPQLSGTFSESAQMELARKLADGVGYDWQSGRLDKSVHPFSSGTAQDARITTRVDATDPLGCLYSTVHELGHAMYEQGITGELGLTPVNNHVSLGVHESQSRLWENQIARGRPFCQWFAPRFQDAFGDCGIDDADDLYRAVNRVETGFIRTESDEVHYNLHVLLRFELERELMAGELDVGDLQSEWNRRFERDFGRAVPDAANGVLQDVHWSVGLFGYFPTYSLGNIYAAQLDVALRQQISDLDDQLAEGQTGAVLSWLRDNVHRHGSLHEPADLMQQASGQAVSAEPLLDYLETKYGEMFDL